MRAMLLRLSSSSFHSVAVTTSIASIRLAISTDNRPDLLGKFPVLFHRFEVAFETGEPLAYSTDRLVSIRVFDIGFASYDLLLALCQ